MKAIERASSRSKPRRLRMSSRKSVSEEALSCSTSASALASSRRRRCTVGLPPLGLPLLEAAVRRRACGCAAFRPAAADLRPFAAFDATAPDFFRLGIFSRRLAGIYQDRIVHSRPLATPWINPGPTLYSAYAFGFPNRIDLMTAPIAIIIG